MERNLAKTIGAAARSAREVLGLTQEEAAEHIGISLVFYARIERGETMPSTPTLAAISQALDVSADALLGQAKTAGHRAGGAVASLSGHGEPEIGPELRRLVRRLRDAKPRTVRLLCQLATDLKTK